MDCNLKQVRVSGCVYRLDFVAEGFASTAPTASAGININAIESNYNNNR